MISWLRPALIAFVSGVVIGVVGLWGIQRGGLKPSAIGRMTSSDTVLVNAPPIFIRDTTRITIVRYRPGTVEAPKPETVTVSPEEFPEPKFSLRLKSPSYKAFGLDSMVLSYFYPQGKAVWTPYLTPSKPPPSYSGRECRSIFGIQADVIYRTYKSKIIGSVYGNLNLGKASVLLGYNIENNNHPSWFLGVRKEFWRLF